MSRVSSPSFIGEFALMASPAEGARLNGCLLAHGNLYNACLGEARKRAQQMRAHPTWRAARDMPKGTAEERKARGLAFAACCKTFGFSAYHLQKYALTCRDACWLKRHIGGADLQVTSDRAFHAVRAWVVGLRGKPRVKATRTMRCLSGKSNAATVRLRQDNEGRWYVAVRGMALSLLCTDGPREAWQTEALAHRVKYVRILRRALRGRIRWYAQVVFEGQAPTKAKHSTQAGVVGIDMGPRTLAVVGPPEAGPEGVFKAMLCPGTEGPRRLKRRLARQLDRSRRATNPGNFDAQGRAKRGCKWVRSTRYGRIRARLAEAERVLVATRKTEQGTHIHRVLALGTTIRLERLNYRAWQKCFGRSVGNHAPGQFVQTLAYKAASAGGRVTMFSTRHTKLSQYDHKTGSYTRKPLRQRQHIFADGGTVDPEIYSAWLARFVEEDRLVTTQLHQSWGATGAWLEGCAVTGAVPQPMSGKGLPDPRRRKMTSPQNRSHTQGVKSPVEAWEVRRQSSRPGETGMTAPRISVL